MTPHHAAEIILTRPITNGELNRARRAIAFASNADRTRLLTLQRAKAPGRALRVLRRRLDDVLPIDVLTSHYPDRRGSVRLNFALSHTVCTAIRQAAEVCGQRPRDFVSQAVTDAVARDDEERTCHLTTQLEVLLVRHTPEELLLCAASAVNRRRHGGKSSSPLS